MTNGTITISMIFDLILLAVLVGVALLYMKRGLVAGLLQFGGNLLSLAGAVILSNHVAPLLFDRFFEGSVQDRIEGVLSAGGTIDAGELVETYAGFLPQGLKDSLISGAQGMLGHVGSAPELAARLVEDVVAPLLTPIIAIVLFFAAFAICRLLVSFVVAVMTNLNKIPVLGGVNKLLGLGMGLLAGAVDLYLLLCGVWALIVITGGSIPFLNETVLADSYAYGLFGKINPFY